MVVPDWVAAGPGSLQQYQLWLGLEEGQVSHNPPLYLPSVSCSHQAELLSSGCLAAWVEVGEEAVEGPERRQRGPEAVVRQGGDAQGPEEAWRTALQAAS